MLFTIVACSGENGKTDESNTDESVETGGTDSDLHAIYTNDDPLALGGLKPPYYQSRAYLDKALPTETKKDITIGFTQNSLSMQWFVDIAEAVKERAEEYGYTVNHLVCEFSAETQSQQIDTFITQGVDVILLDSTDLVTGGEVTRRAVEAGIPVIGIGQELEPDVPIVTSILSNSFMSAWEVGTILAEEMDGKPIKSAPIYGGMGMNSSESRITGMMAAIIYYRAQAAGDDMLKEDAMMAGLEMQKEIRASGKSSYPDYDFEIIASNANGGWTEEGGMAAAEDLLTGNPEINVLLVDQDFMGAGAVKAIEDMGLKAGGEDGIQIVCAADSYKPALKYIRDGKMLATGYGAPLTIGYTAVDLVKMIFEEGYDANNMPVASDLPAIAITVENLDDYYDEGTNFAKAIEYDMLTIDEYNELNK